jgi:hypothetical protein
MNPEPLSREALDTLQRDTFTYFKKETNLLNGLVPDSTRHGSHCSIAAVGLGLAAYPVAVERNFISREEAASITATLHFFGKVRGTAPDATGHKGPTITSCIWTRDAVRNCELDYRFDDSNCRRTYCCHLLITKQNKTEIRTLANDLYLRMDWQWALNRDGKVSMGWKPEWFRRGGRI